MPTTKRADAVRPGDVILEERVGVNLMTGEMVEMAPSQSLVIAVVTEAEDPDLFVRYRLTCPTATDRTIMITWTLAGGTGKVTRNHYHRPGDELVIR